MRSTSVYLPKSIGPQPGAAEQDEDGTSGPAGEVDRMRHPLGRITGEVRSAEIAGEEPGDPGGDADDEQRRRDDGAPAPGGDRARGGDCARGSGPVDRDSALADRDSAQADRGSRLADLH